MGVKALLHSMLTGALLVGITPALAQDSDSGSFTLFEGLDSTNSNNAASAAGRNSNNGRGNTRATQAQPTFTLVGTSRIGDNRKALLRHMSGEVVQVPLTDSINTVPGHELYAIVNHGAGQVSLRFPAAVPCGDFPELGVSCDSNTNISSMSITTGDAIASVQQVQPMEESESEVEEDNPAGQAESVRNPFAAIRDRGRAGSNQAAPASQFQPRRIAPEDVPPGKRVVSTPFGDRLVDI